MFKECGEDIFQDNGFHPTDLYFGSGGGKAIEVTNLETGEQAIDKIMEQGKGCSYTLLVKSLQVLFAEKTDTDSYFAVIVPLMESVFAVLATQLRQLPVLADSDPNVGPNAGTSFQYVDTSLDQLLTQAQQLNDSLQNAATENPNLQSLAANVNRVYQALENISGKQKTLT